MARIAPRDLVHAVAAAKPGDRIELDAGELVGQVIIDKPLVIEGRGAGTWLGNRTGPVLIIRCSGVELHDLQIEMTGDLQHPAILVEGDREPVQHNVTIRRGELRVERPRLSFAAAPPIRLREHTPPVPARTVPPRLPPSRAPTQPTLTPRHAPTQPAVAPTPAKPQPATVAPARAKPQPPSTPLPPSSPARPVTPRASGSMGSARVPRTYAAIAIIALGLFGFVVFAASKARRSTPTSSGLAPLAPGARIDTTAPRAPPVDAIELTKELRTNIEVVSWSPDEERFVLDLSYGRDSSDLARWRVRAVIDAPSEKVLQWQDLSGLEARVAGGEPSWPARTETALPIDGFKSGSVIEPSRLRVRWCEKQPATRFPTRIRQLGQELELTWDSSGTQLTPEACREGDAGWSLVYVADSPWRLMRYSPRKGGTTALRVYGSPGQGRAVVITLDRNNDKVVARFWTRLVGPQIHILSSDQQLRADGLRRLVVPGLLMSEDPQDPILPPSRILVPSDDEAAYQIALPLAGRFNLPIERAIGDSRYLWGDVLIVLKEPI